MKYINNIMIFDEFYKTIYKELRERNYRVTLTGIRDELLMHPYYPSLQSVADYFTDINIPNIAVRIDFQQLSTALMEADVLVLFKDENGENLLWIKKIDSTHIYSVNSKPITHEIFFKKWDGISLIFQIDKYGEETNYSYNYSTEKYKKTLYVLLLIAFLCLSFLYCSNNSFSISSFFSLLPKYGGLFFAFLLSITDMGFKIPLAEKLCSISTNKGCEKVSNSRISSITQRIKLADVGVIYFFTIILYQLIGDYHLLAYISLFCIPIIFISIIYQSFYLKVFCPLCIGVMSMLSLDIILYYVDGIYSIKRMFSYYDLLLFLGIAGIISSFWLILKKMIEDKNNIENYKYKYYRILRYPERIQLLPDDISIIKKMDYDIILGDKSPQIIITEFVNPFCWPCGHSIQKAIKLLEIFPEGLQIIIRFVNTKNGRGENNQIISHLLFLAKTSTDQQFMKALTDWFTLMDYTLWNAKYPIYNKLSINDLNEYLSKTKEFGIRYTPTIFLNKKRLPSDLTIGDLRYYIEEEISVK
jgi:hypothetical protein